MNRVLLTQLDAYLRLNTSKVSAVFDKFGIPVGISPSPYSVVEAYQHFREPFCSRAFQCALSRDF